MEIKLNNGVHFEVTGFQKNWFSDRIDYNFQLVNSNDLQTALQVFKNSENLDTVILERTGGNIVYRNLELDGVNESIEDDEIRTFIRLKDKEESEEVSQTLPEDLL